MAQPEELADVGLVFGAVHFVGYDEHRLIRLPQQFRDALVQRRQAGLHIDHKQDEVGARDREADLLLDIGLEVIGVDDADPAGIHQLEIARWRVGIGRGCQLDRDAYAVAGDSGARIDDADPLAREHVEQRAFADVRPADDRDERERHSRILAWRRSDEA